MAPRLKTPEQIERMRAAGRVVRLVLTRLGEGSRMAVTGDPSQVDLVNPKDSGLAHAVSILERPHAVAELYGTNLVVRAEDHTSAILLTRHAIKRAKRDALPRALLQ